MPEWERVRLGEVLLPVPTTRRENVDTEKDYPLLGVRLNNEGPFLRETKKGADSAATSLFRVQAGDFIYSRLFAWRGALGLIPPELDGCYVSNEFPLFTAKDNRIDLEYLNFWFHLPDVIRSIEADCTGSTPLTRNRYKEIFFLALAIPLPPLPEQRRIVARVKGLLTKVEEVRGLQERVNAEMRFLLKASIKAEFDDLKCCPIVPLEAVCSAIVDNLHSNPEYSETGVPCLRSSDVGWFELNLNSAKRTSEEEYVRRTIRGEPQENDIVLVREGGGTGKAAIVRTGHRFSLGQRVMMIRVNPNIVMPEFFLHQLLSPQIQEDQISTNFKGSAAPHLNIGTLRKFNFICPNLNKQKEVVKNLNRIYKNNTTMSALSNATSFELDALPASILARAFTGAL